MAVEPENGCFWAEWVAFNSVDVKLEKTQTRISSCNKSYSQTHPLRGGCTHKNTTHTYSVYLLFTPKGFYHDITTWNIDLSSLKMSIPLCLTITHLLVHPPLRRSMLRDAGNALRLLPDSQISASSMRDIHGATGAARLVASRSGWFPSPTQPVAGEEWLQVDLGVPKTVRGIITQGARGVDGSTSAENRALWGSINSPIVWMEKTGATIIDSKTNLPKVRTMQDLFNAAMKNTTTKTKFIY